MTPDRCASLADHMIDAVNNCFGKVKTYYATNMQYMETNVSLQLISVTKLFPIQVKLN